VVTHTYIPKRKPVEAYLQLQGRFRHLFEPTLQTHVIRHIQERVDAYWQQTTQEQA
jgi:pyruvate ferredoxin oxidoreductase beta subunit